MSISAAATWSKADICVGSSTNSIRPIEQLHGHVEYILAHLEEVHLSGLLSLGDVSGSRSAGRRMQREHIGHGVLAEPVGRGVAGAGL